MSRRVMILTVGILCLLLPTRLAAQGASVPDTSVQNSLARYMSLPAKLRLQSGVVVEMGQRHETGRFEAVFLGVRSDSVVLESSDRRSAGVAALLDVRSLEVGIPRTSEQGLAHGALNGAIIGAGLGISFRLFDNLAATDASGQRLHGTFDGSFGEALITAVVFAVPGALAGVIFPGRRWEEIWPR